MMKSILGLPITALLIATAVAAPENATNGAPFKGVIEGTESFADGPGSDELTVDGNGTGKSNNSAHLGRFTTTWKFLIDLPTKLGTGNRTFVAADGSQLHAKGIGKGTPRPEQFVVTAYLITGGTGRFEGASGGFIVQRLVHAFGDGPFKTEGRFSGTIILADKGKK